MFAALSARMHDATTIYLTVEEPAGGGLAVPDGTNGPWLVGTPDDASMEVVEVVDDATIAVHIDTPVAPGDAVTLTYEGSMVDNTDKVQGLDADHNPVYLADFAGMNVTNGLGGGQPATVSNPNVSAAITATLVSGAAPAPANSQVNDATAKQPTVGTGTNNVNAVYSANRTIASGSNDDIDLSTLTDPLGNAINFTSIRSYKITNNGTTGQTLTIGGAATNPIIAAAESSEPVQALGGFRCEDFPDGGLVVDSTHKTLRITAGGGGTVSYAITVAGKQ